MQAEADALGHYSLTAAISEEKETIEDIREPYLLQLGFLSRTPQGRVVTPTGLEHIGLELPATRERMRLFL